MNWFLLSNVSDAEKIIRKCLLFYLYNKHNTAEKVLINNRKKHSSGSLLKQNNSWPGTTLAEICIIDNQKTAKDYIAMVIIISFGNKIFDSHFYKKKKKKSRILRNISTVTLFSKNRHIAYLLYLFTTEKIQSRTQSWLNKKIRGLYIEETKETHLWSCFHSIRDVMRACCYLFC